VEDPIAQGIPACSSLSSHVRTPGSDWMPQPSTTSRYNSSFRRLNRWISSKSSDHCNRSRIISTFLLPKPLKKCPSGKIFPSSLAKRSQLSSWCFELSKITPSQSKIAAHFAFIRRGLTPFELRVQSPSRMEDQKVRLLGQDQYHFQLQRKKEPTQRKYHHHGS